MVQGRRPGKEETSEVRRQIERSALEVFARKGYHGASVRDVLEAAGVSAPTLYYHYRSKEGLYRHLIRKVTGRLREQTEQASAAPGSTRDRLRLAVRSQLLGLLERPVEARFMLRVATSWLQTGECHEEVVSGHLDGAAVSQILEAGVARRELDETRLELMFNALVGGLTLFFARRMIATLLDEAPTPPLADAPAPATTETDRLEQQARLLAETDQIIELFLEGAAAEGDDVR